MWQHRVGKLCGKIVTVLRDLYFSRAFYKSVTDTGSIRFYVDPKAVTNGSKYCYTVLP